MASPRLSDILHVAIRQRGNIKSWCGFVGLFLIPWFDQKNSSRLYLSMVLICPICTIFFCKALYILDFDFKFSQNVPYFLKLFTKNWFFNILDCDILCIFVFSTLYSAYLNIYIYIYQSRNQAVGSVFTQLLQNDSRKDWSLSIFDLLRYRISLWYRGNQFPLEILLVFAAIEIFSQVQRVAWGEMLPLLDLS